jgi:hypothetical protein
MAAEIVDNTETQEVTEEDLLDTSQVMNPHDVFAKTLLLDVEMAKAACKDMIPKELIDLFDWAKFSIEGTELLGDDAATQHCDLLYKIPIKNNERECFVFIVYEHQSSVDAMIPVRVLSYIVRIYQALLRHDAN